MDNKMLGLCIQNILYHIRKIYEGDDIFQQFSKVANSLIVKDENDAELVAKKTLYEPLINFANVIVNNKEKNADFSLDHIQPLDSIFNLLSQNETHLQYDEINSDGISFPSVHTEFNTGKWHEIQVTLLENLKKLSVDENGLNKLFDLCEEKFSYVSCSNHKEQNNFISLSDCIKFSTCICSNIYEYAKTNKLDIYSSKSYDFNQNSLLLFSFGFSGIQKFIYTVAGDDALKCLRSRSFYLDMLLEHVSNCIISELGLPISNILYSGGGRANLLLPNTDQAKELIKSSMRNINKWLLANFDISLYVTYSCESFSPNELFSNNTKDSSDIFTKSHSDMKFHRYNAEQIKELNNTENSDDNGRECRICSQCGKLNNDDVCSFCRSFIDVSGFLLKPEYLLVITNKEYKFKEYKPYLKFPSLNGDDCFAYFLTDAELDEMDNSNIIQIYNTEYKKNARKLQIASYGYQINGKLATFEELSNESDGIEKIGIMRADIDNLGSIFTTGFKSNNQLMLKAALSKQLTLFFKKYINSILRGSLNENQSKNSLPKKVIVVYSGGDDLFIAGSWNDVIETAMDIKICFDKFTANTLTFSAGIGIFKTKYPIYAMAEETEKLEDYAKEMDEDKNAVSLFGPNIKKHTNGKYHIEYPHSYKWNTFVDKVVNDKLKMLQDYFDIANVLSSANGNSFLFRLKQYIEEKENDNINIARFAYLLSRMQPNTENKDIKEKYSKFASSMYEWILNETDRKQLLTAITIYIYLNRGVNK